MRGAPQRGLASAILRINCGGAGPALGVRRWCASAGPAPAEAAAMPADDGGRAHDDQRRRPVWPQAPQTNPEQPIRPARGGLGSAALIHGQLLPEGEVLEGDGTMSANEESDQPKSLHEPDDHGSKIARQLVPECLRGSKHRVLANDSRALLAPEDADHCCLAMQIQVVHDEVNGRHSGTVG